MIKEEKKRPAVRFKGFEDDWEPRKLGSVGYAKSGTGFPEVEQGGEEGIPFFKVSDMNLVGNEIELIISNNYVTQEQIKRKHWNVISDVPAIFFAKVGAAVMLNRKRLVRVPFLLDNNTMAYIFDKDIWDCYFGKTLFETINLSQLIQVGALPSYGTSDVEGISIMLPRKEEQRKLAAYFSSLDDRITLHQRKLDQVKTLKKYFLQNMFPAEGETVPKIRIKGFTGDWEQSKLSDLANFSKGTGYSKSDLKESGTPIILYGRLYTKYETVIKYVDTFAEARENSVYSQGGEVIVPASGETAEDISVASVVEESGVLLGGDLNVILPNEKIDSTFLAFSISNGEAHRDMARRAQGKSVVHLHNEDLAQINLRYPTFEEQKKISLYLCSINNRITLHQRKVDQLQTLKKFMLQNLFV